MIVESLINRTHLFIHIQLQQNCKQPLCKCDPGYRYTDLMFTVQWGLSSGATSTNPTLQEEAKQQDFSKL